MSQTLHDELQAELQAELDAAMADLENERGAKAKEAEARKAAQAEVTRLEGEIGSMDDAASDAEGVSLHARLKHANAEVTRLTGELTTANDKVTELTARIGTAGDAESLLGMLETEKAKATRLAGELEAADTSLTSLRGQLTTAQTSLATEAERAEQAEQAAQQARQEASQRAQSLEANQRAKLLDKALAALTGAYVAPVTPNVKSGSAFTLRNYSHSSLSAPNLRGSRLTYPAFGETIVAYTDRELTRRLLDHYYTNREGDDNAAKATATRLVVLGIPNLSLDNVIAADSQVRLNGHGLPTSYTGDMAPTERTSVTGNFSGTVHGVSGTFECGTGCGITLTPDYDTDKRLIGVEVAVLEDLFFKSSGSVTLDGTTAKGGFTDDEYMVFGWWRSKPVSLPGSYDFETFVVPTAVGQAPNTGRYIGTAAGMYAETDAATVAKQGEFTANVLLTVASGGVTGDINTFQTTPTDGSVRSTTSGSWRVVLGSGDSATITGVPGSSASMGSWSRNFVAARMACSWGKAIHQQLLASSIRKFLKRYTLSALSAPSCSNPAADVAGVSGWFNAATNDSNAAIAGAFGAAFSIGTMCAK